MIEIWMEEKKWESIREKLLKGYIVSERYRRRKGKIEKEGQWEV